MKYLKNIETEKEFRLFLGERLRYIRINKNLTQADIAELLDLSNNYISEVERGRYNISLFLIFKFCDSLDISINELLGFKNDDFNLTFEQRDLIKKFFEYFKSYNKEAI